MAPGLFLSPEMVLSVFLGGLWIGVVFTSTFVGMVHPGKPERRKVGTIYYIMNIFLGALMVGRSSRSKVKSASERADSPTESDAKEQLLAPETAPDEQLVTPKKGCVGTPTKDDLATPTKLQSTTTTTERLDTAKLGAETAPAKGHHDCADCPQGISEPLTLVERKSRKIDPYCQDKREGYLSWDDYFMAIAFLSASRSKDPNKQVGACIVSMENIILGIGYNGFPRGCPDDSLPWAKLAEDGDVLKTKYPFVCHAEMNAILNKNAASVRGQRIYVTLFPCNECAKLIIQSGITEVVYYEDKDAAGGDQFAAAKILFNLAGVEVRQHKPSRKIHINFPSESESALKETLKIPPSPMKL